MHITSQNSFNRLAFITDTGRVLCEAGTEVLLRNLHQRLSSKRSKHLNDVTGFRKGITMTTRPQQTDTSFWSVSTLRNGTS